MVSTRQMATSNTTANCGSNTINGGHHNHNQQQQQQQHHHHSNHNSSQQQQQVNNNVHGVTAAESTRPSVVTRQTTSNNVLDCNTTIGGASTSTSSSSWSSTRNLTQAVKTNGGNLVALNNGGNTTNTRVKPQMSLFDLPEEVLGYIFSFLSYKNIGQLRLVSTQLNTVCMHILNSTFSKLITQTYNRFHAIKANMPRRESARRNHPLSCECDIIETCYMRLSLLQMTFGKHIERGHCCFFPAAILDEVYTILNIIRNTPRLERPYRVTDELFDLSTMAMEYFRDRIESTLPEICYFNKDFFKLPTTTKRAPSVILSDLSDSSSSLPSPPQSNMVLRKGIRKIRQGMKIYNNQLSVLRSELRNCKRKGVEQGKQITEQQKLLAEQQKQTLEYANRLDENDKKNEEISRKFSTLLQELNKCKTELQYWRSKSPAIPTCTSCGQKVTPLLPPEDYQALVNQGVKPEDILNLNDDTDAESDVSMGEPHLTYGNQFALPDEVTTAKLLAVNTAAKNLKRQNANANAIASTTTNTSTMNTSGASAQQEACSDGATKPSEMTNSLEFAKRGNIIRSVTASGGKASSEVKLNEANTFATIASSKMPIVLPIMQGYSTSCDGYSTKLFYGSRIVHKGVIVSPPCTAGAVATEQLVSDQGCGGGGDGCSATSTDSVANHELAQQQQSGVEDVSTLQAISSHETKKARRVQKATRCLNGSGKRSK